MASRLSRLMRPRSIAVIGGGVWGANVVRECRNIGFDGALWAVHPSRREVGGAPAYQSVADLPAAPDASFIGVNRRTSVAMMAALAARGAGGAVCFASGFREADPETGDGADLQAALVAAADGMALLGPNCYGFINAFDGVAVWPDQHGLIRRERGVAVISQSSNIALNLTMQARGLPIGYMLTLGNQAQIGAAEAGRALIEDARVTALGMYLEGVGDLAAFEELALTARRLAKPIVVMKIGASDAAQAAVASHTASLVGGDAGAAALFERLGVGRATSLPAFLEALKLLHVHGPLTSARLASMSCSGGEAGVMADSAQRAGRGDEVTFPALTPCQRAALQEVLGPHVALANPLDYHTYIWNDQAALTRCFSAMMAPTLGLGCVMLDFPRADRCDARDWTAVVEAAADCQAACGAPMAIVASLGETMPEAAAEAMQARGLAPMCGVSETLEAAGVAARIGRSWRRPPAPPLAIPAPAPPMGAVETLSEAASKALLARHGVAAPASRRATSPAEAAAAAAALGFPVALKGEGAAHKTEAGLVALRLDAAEAVAQAAARMSADVFLVEEMISDGVAELLIGVVRDPAHGFVLTLGAGGVLAEVLDDTACLLIPSDAAAIAQALGRLRISALLTGHRGAPAADQAAVIAAAMAAQRLALAEAAQLQELEINPLICTPTRAVAVDALLRRAAPGPRAGQNGADP